MSIEDYRAQLKFEQKPAHVMYCLNGGLPRVRCTEAERRELLDETFARLDQVNPQPVERGDACTFSALAV